MDIARLRHLAGLKETMLHEDPAVGAVGYVAIAHAVGLIAGAAVQLARNYHDHGRIDHSKEIISRAAFTLSPKRVRQKVELLSGLIEAVKTCCKYVMARQKYDPALKQPKALQDRLLSEIVNDMSEWLARCSRLWNAPLPEVKKLMHEVLFDLETKVDQLAIRHDMEQSGSGVLDLVDLVDAIRQAL